MEAVSGSLGQWIGFGMFLLAIVAGVAGLYKLRNETQGSIVDGLTTLGDDRRDDYNAARKELLEVRAELKVATDRLAESADANTTLQKQYMELLERSTRLLQENMELKSQNQNLIQQVEDLVRRLEAYTNQETQG